jgi:hypothetical protein
MARWIEVVRQFDLVERNMTDISGYSKRLHTLSLGLQTPVEHWEDTECCASKCLSSEIGLAGLCNLVPCGKYPSAAKHCYTRIPMIPHYYTV